jgi:aminopeptidase N
MKQTKHRRLGPIAFIALPLALALPPTPAASQSTATQPTSTAKQHDQRTPGQLRGSNTAERRWWDLLHYDLAVEIFPDAKKIAGSNQISFGVIESGQRMQIDLQPPLQIDSVTYKNANLKFNRNGNVYWIDFPQPLIAGSQASVRITYSGAPTESVKPPWQGGVSWDKDESGNHFIVTTCQGIGASVWWPCKDYGGDEPNNGMDIQITTPNPLKAVSNGRLIKTTSNKSAGTSTFHWQVKNPINNYAVAMNIGDYVHFADQYDGEFGKLDLDYWVLRDQREVAKTHFKEVPRMLEAFEHWFGKYPFYEDSFKMVAVPYPGMEHQSAVAYGNGFKNGYGGRDLSDTGVGLKFDFIIVHESGHEWFGNSVSMKDVADMWIHESFTNYSETLFVDYHFSKEEASDYVIGCRQLIENDIPIVGTHGIEKKGSQSDMYYKGGNVLHTIRQIINDDKKFRSILRGIQSKYRHSTVTGQEIENYLSQQSGYDLKLFFDQYLRGTDIPEISLSHKGKSLSFQFTNAVPGLSFPVKINANGQEEWITPTTDPQTREFEKPIESISVDRNFYLEASITSGD